MQPSNFGMRLMRLLNYRELDPIWLSRTATIAESELESVFDGQAPSPSMLRRLSPALDLHVADMFVIADLAVPEDLRPLDERVGGDLGRIAQHAIRMQAERRRSLRQYVQSLPEEVRAGNALVQPLYEQYQLNAGAIIVRMLHNRNLRWLNAAKVLFCLARIGPFSPATIGAVGHGRKELSPELLVGFATVLAVPAGDLAALTGVELTHACPPADPAATDVARLIWDMRRLSASQIRQVREAAADGPSGGETRRNL